MEGLYELIIKDKVGNTLASLSGATDRWWGKELNKPGSAGFSLSPLDRQLTADLIRPGQKELFIYRGGVLVWGGEIQTRRTDVGGQDAGTIAVTAKGFLALMGYKVIGTIASPRTFSNEDLSTIADTIRSETQTGTNEDLGVEAGALATSRDGDRTYKYENARQALEGLSNSRVIDGIDIDVDANKQLSASYPGKGHDLEDVVFEWGVNITSYSYIDDATELANRIVVVGKENGASTPVVVRDGPTFLQEDYGVRVDVISRSGVTDTTTLAEWGDKELEKRQQGRQILGLRTKGNQAPLLGSYDVGDRVRVRIKYGIDDIDGLYRITAINVRITDTDEEDVELQFGEDDDVGTSFDELEERVENLETTG
jgi:hypothetical protein